MVSFAPGADAGFGQDRLPGIVLGPPRGGGAAQGSLDVLSLGVGGSIVLSFGDRVAVDGPGPDLLVFENAFAVGSAGFVYAEPAEVAVSADGVTWTAFPCAPQGPAPTGCAGEAPVRPYDPWLDPLDPAVTGGDAFDLADVGVAEARFVRLTDAGNPPGPPSAGFDLDAVGLVSWAPAP